MKVIILSLPLPTKIIQNTHLWAHRLGTTELKPHQVLKETLKNDQKVNHALDSCPQMVNMQANDTVGWYLIEMSQYQHELSYLSVCIKEM